jgi:glycosyltransferase involved in cell wall biosynthesis
VLAKFQSKGLFRRILITIQSAFNQGEINHITGDIHFVALFLRKRKTILTIHDIGSVINKKGIKGKILRFFWFTLPIARVRYITVISEFTKEEILQQFKVNPDKIIVIPDCVSTELQYIEKDFKHEQPNILQIGTKTNKNLPNLFAALEGISCKLTIVGFLSDEQKKLLNKYQIMYENYVNLPFSDIVALYRQSDIVTFISTYEGFGVPILEAQATGRVVITSNLSPMKDVAGDGALLVNPNSLEEISSAIKKVVSEPEFRNSLIHSGTENVKKYSAESVAHQYYNLYKQM